MSKNNINDTNDINKTDTNENTSSPVRMNQKNEKSKFIPRKIEDYSDNANNPGKSTLSLSSRIADLERQKSINEEHLESHDPEVHSADLVYSPQLQLAPQRKGFYRGTKIRKATKLEESTENLGHDTLKIIPLGGLCEVGKNTNVFEFGNDLIIGDCGQMFPGDDEPGIDTIIADFSYIEKNIDKLRAIFLTHGHEDHIGGMPYLLKKINRHVPIYAGKIAVELLKSKFEEHGLTDYISDLNVVLPREKRRAGCFEVEFVTVNHSIADAFALAIKSPIGTVILSGDWKVDFTPVTGDPIDLARFAELGEEGVLCFISESTNIEREGYTVSEKTVGETFEHEFSKAEGRIFVATFASNTSRVQQIITAAENNGRKVALVGRSMLNVFEASNKLGYIKMKHDTLIELDEVNNLPDDEVCVISTGSQGEPMSALTRMAYAEHRSVEIVEGDTVIISATPIPGNEKPIYQVINELYKRGAKVVYSSISEVHVSGHANREEHKLLHTLIKPKYFIPAHGEYRMLYMNAKLAVELGMPADNVFILNNGDILEIDKKAARISGYTSAGAVLIDGQSATVNDSLVLRQRKDLSSDGILSVALTLDKDHNLINGPEVLSYGALLESDEENANALISDFVIKYLNKNKENQNLINNLRSRQFRNELLNFFYNRTGRKPVTLVSVLEYEE